MLLKMYHCFFLKVKHWEADVNGALQKFTNNCSYYIRQAKDQK